MRSPDRRWSRWIVASGALLLVGFLIARLGFATQAAADRPIAPEAEIAQSAAGERTAQADFASVRHTIATTASHNWIATWGAASQAAIAQNMSRRGFANQTLREIAYTSVGGSQVRIRISNAFGSTPLQLGAAAIGIQGSLATIRPGTSRALSFGGAGTVLIPSGAEAYSDPVSLTVAPLERLSVSLYLPHHTGPATNHDLARQINYVAGGNHADQLAATGFSTRTQSWYYLDGIDVLAPSRDRGAVVTLGDSITDGVGSTLGGETRWPNFLAQRLDALHGSTLGVIDEGIGGNRLLSNSSCCGENAVARFQRDVASQPGAREVILLEGVNDIGYSLHSNAATSPHTDVSAAEIISGYEQIIAQARVDGLTVLGATITPFKGARYWSRAGEAKRAAVNQWIRTSGAFNGVIDFAKAVADPRDAETLNPARDSGDHLHPNPAGYKAMAAAIDLTALVRDA